jgi:hypothetical protein
MERPTRSRSGPRISAAKIAEFLDGASVRRRERIVKDQKNPPTYIVTRYKKAMRTIQDALVANSDVPGKLAASADRIEQMVPRNPQEADSLRLNGEAVRRFTAIFGKLALKGTTPLLVTPRGFGVRTEGVVISVAPIVLLRRSRPAKGEEWGAILGVFRKREALGVHGGKVAAELVRIALSKHGYNNIRADMCIAIDVFSGQIFTASGTGQRIAEEIAAACREIAARWDIAA